MTLRFRPAGMLAATLLAQGRALVQRGIAAANRIMTIPTPEEQ